MSHPDARLLSLAHLTLHDTSPPDLVSAAADAGFDAVGIRLGRGSRPGDVAWPMLGDTPMLLETQRRLADTGLRVLEVEGVSLMPDRPLTAFTHLGALLESAATLGAEFLTVASFEADANRTAEQLASLCDSCVPYGLQPALEFMPRSGVPTLQQALQMMLQPGCERATVLLDVLHFVRSGGSTTDLRTNDSARIGLLQLCDARLAPPLDDESRRAESRNRCLPGDGELPLAELVATLPLHLPMSVEAPAEDNAQSSASERAELALRATRRVLKW